MTSKILQNQLKDITNLPQTIQPILLGALLAKLFKEKETSLTIVGGAAVQLYTQSSYTTKDLDAILFGDTIEIIEDVMASVGFKRTSTYRHFENPKFKFVVEFPPSPVEVGGREISKFYEIQTQFGSVRVIRIEDIIMDQIIAGVEWKSKPSIGQAKLIWRKNKIRIDKKYLKQFAKEEGYLETLNEIMKF